MKNFTIILLLLITFLTFAQRTVTKDVGDFSELKIYDLIEVNLIQSSENKVIIKGEHSGSVKILNENGKLKIRMELDERFNGEDTFVEVYFTNISVIDANEGSIIVAINLIEQNKIELRSQEGAKIKVALKVNTVTIKAISGGIIEVSGTSKNQDITINSGGIVEGKDLKTEDSIIRITAAGEAEIYVTNNLDAKVTAGGDIVIYGNPKNVKQKKLAGGDIHFVH
ncbi:MAG: chaperonin [Flavobacterium sp.]|nr:MAG: chaperonin [Flavobacterium sp.]